MLILQSDRVRFCPAIRRVAGEVESFQALEYRGRLFSSGETFDKAQRKAAVHRVREILDAPQDIILALVEDAQGYTLWYEDEGIVERVDDSSNGREFRQGQPAGKANSTLGQLFPTFQLIAERFRPSSEGVALAAENQR